MRQNRFLRLDTLKEQVPRGRTGALSPRIISDAHGFAVSHEYPMATSTGATSTGRQTMRSTVISGMMLCLLAAVTAPAVAADYGLTRWRYGMGDDPFAAVWHEFRDSARLAIAADWQDVRNTCSDHAACLALAQSIGREAALVLRDGKAFCPGGRYFVWGFSDPPRRYQLIEHLAAGPLSLLCGSIDGPVLAKLADVGEPAGVVAPDWTLYLSHLRWFAPRRVRDISARLEFYGFSPAGELLWRLNEYDDRASD